jgi:hypothetical protein
LGCDHLARAAFGVETRRLVQPRAIRHAAPPALVWLSGPRSGSLALMTERALRAIRAVSCGPGAVSMKVKRLAPALWNSEPAQTVLDTVVSAV